MKPVLISVSMAAFIAACGQTQQRPSFDGQFFRASASKAGDTRAEFAVSVRGVSASLKGALQAAEYEATRYCVTRFGSSDIDWEIGPDQDPETLNVTNDTLSLNGQCNE